MADRAALVIATDRYENRRLDGLRAPVHDAAALEEVLRDPEIGAFQVTSLVNAPSSQVMEEVDRFFQHRSPEDLLLLYFSCHGIKDAYGRLYLAASNTRLSVLAATGVSGPFLNEQIERSRSRRIVLMLDCCYSGAFVKGFAPRANKIVTPSEDFQGVGRVVITASTAMEYAFEGEQLTSDASRTAIFTTAVVDGLKTGDADLDHDGRVSIDELYDFVFDSVRKKVGTRPPPSTRMCKGAFTSRRTLVPTHLGSTLLRIPSKVARARFHGRGRKLSLNYDS